MGNIKLLLIAMILAGIGYYVWNERHLRQVAEKNQEEAEMQIGLDAARILNTKFTTSAQLKVATYSGDGVGYGKYDGTVFHPTQKIQAPVSVDYFLNLREINSRSYFWNKESNVLTVSMPDVTIGKPNIDLDKAVITQNGVFISRQAALAMNKASYRGIVNKAIENAKSEVEMKKARESARNEMSKFVQQTLDAAQRSKIQVAISFPWEPKPASGNLEIWDITRSPREVMADKRDAGKN